MEIQELIAVQEELERLKKLQTQPAPVLCLIAQLTRVLEALETRIVARGGRLEHLEGRVDHLEARVAEAGRKDE